MKWALVVKGWAYRVLGGQEVGLQGPRGSGGWAYRVPRDKQVGLQGPRGSRGMPTGSQGVKG